MSSWIQTWYKVLRTTCLAYYNVPISTFKRSIRLACNHYNPSIYFPCTFTTYLEMLNPRKCIASCAHTIYFLSAIFLPLDFLLFFKLANLINHIFYKHLKEDYSCLYVINGKKNVWLLAWYCCQGTFSVFLCFGFFWREIVKKKEGLWQDVGRGTKLCKK